MIDKNKFFELGGKIITKKDIKIIRVLDKQLSEDKRLFCFLMDNGLVSEEGEILIRELVTKHTREFE